MIKYRNGRLQIHGHLRCRQNSFALYRIPCVNSDLNVKLSKPLKAG